MPSLQAALRLGVNEVALVDDARWAELVGMWDNAPVPANDVTAVSWK